MKLNQLYDFFSHLEWQLQTRFHGLTCGYEYWGARYIVGVCGTIMADKEAFKKDIIWSSIVLYAALWMSSLSWICCKIWIFSSKGFLKLLPSCDTISIVNQLCSASDLDDLKNKLYLFFKMVILDKGNRYKTHTLSNLSQFIFNINLKSKFQLEAY